jgi:hypothetical protein
MAPIAIILVLSRTFHEHFVDSMRHLKLGMCITSSVSGKMQLRHDFGIFTLAAAFKVPVFSENKRT